MGKRSSSGTSHKAKAVKLSPPPEVDEIAEKPAQDTPEAPVLALLEETAQVISMPASVHEMLSAGIPHCFPPKSAFQESMIEMLQESFRNAEASRREAVESAQAKLNEITSATESGSTKIEDAKNHQALKLKMRDEKGAEMTSAKEDLSKAKCALDEAETKQKNIAELNKEHTATKESYEQLMKDSWTPLKEFIYVGKEWRMRDKQITRVMEAFEKIDIPESLAGALPVVFKTKPEARGAFSSEVLKYGEAAIARHITMLSENISNSETNVDECNKEIEGAKEKVKACVEALSAFQDEFIAAENDYCEATTKLSDEISKHAALQPELELAKKTLCEKQQENSEMLKKLAVFEHLRDPKPPETAEVSKVTCEETVKDSGDAEMRGMPCDQTDPSLGIEQ